MDGNDGTREESEDGTMFVQMDEVMRVGRCHLSLNCSSSLSRRFRYGETRESRK